MIALYFVYPQLLVSCTEFSQHEPIDLSLKNFLDVHYELVDNELENLMMKKYPLFLQDPIIIPYNIFSMQNMFKKNIKAIRQTNTILNSKFDILINDPMIPSEDLYILSFLKENLMDLVKRLSLLKANDPKEGTIHFHLRYIYIKKLLEQDLPMSIGNILTNLEYKYIEYKKSQVSLKMNIILSYIKTFIQNYLKYKAGILKDVNEILNALEGVSNLPQDDIKNL